MKKTLPLFLSTTLIAFVLEYPGWWWAMPLVGFGAGFIIGKGGKSLLIGGLGVATAWAVYLISYAVNYPLKELLTVFSGILGLPASLSFVPVLLALIIAFLLGGLGGLTGALAPHLVKRTEQQS